MLLELWLEILKSDFPPLEVFILDMSDFLATRGGHQV